MNRIVKGCKNLPDLHGLKISLKIILGHRFTESGLKNPLEADAGKVPNCWNV